MEANDRQVGGDHYQSDIQHWDWCAANNLDYFQGCITKYVARWKDKNGIEDLRKAHHYLEKYIEVVEANTPGTEVLIRTDGPPDPTDILNALRGGRYTVAHGTVNDRNMSRQHPADRHFDEVTDAISNAKKRVQDGGEAFVWDWSLQEVAWEPGQADRRATAVVENEFTVFSDRTRDDNLSQHDDYNSAAIAARQEAAQRDAHSWIQNSSGDTVWDSRENT